jgi:uncharacterized protein (TIGR02246 family)
MRTALALLAAIVAAASAVAADLPAITDDKAAIKALEDTYSEAFGAKDVTRIMSVYVPGKELFVFDIVPPREYAGSEAYRKDWEALFAMYPGAASMAISEQALHVVGSVAYGHNIQTAEVTGKDGKKQTLISRTTDVYRKIKGQWLIVEEHNSVPVDLATFKPDLMSKP